MFKHRVRAIVAILVAPLIAAIAIDFSDTVFRLLGNRSVSDESIGFWMTRLFNVYLYTFVYAPLCYLLTILLGIPTLKLLFRFGHLRLRYVLLLGILLGAFAAPIIMKIPIILVGGMKTNEPISLALFGGIFNLESILVLGFSGACVSLGIWLIAGLESKSES